MAPTRANNRVANPRVAIAVDQVADDAAPDQQDGLVQAAAVSAALRRQGFVPTLLPLTLDLERAAAALRALSPGFVFNLVESLAGQGRLIHLAPALFDSLDLPYSGAGTEAMFTSSNKLLAKRMLRAAGIATAEWIEAAGVSGAASAAGGPWIVKSVWEHASIGLDAGAVVESGAEVAAALDDRQRRFGGTWFAERFIDGREFNLALLAGEDDGPPQILPAAEIRFVDFPAGRPKIVDYAAKWQEDSFEYRNTQRCFPDDAADTPLIAALSAMALDCWHLFGLRGYARVDFRVDAAGRPFVLEVNANPCLAPDAGFAAALDQAEIGFDAAIGRIAADLNRPAGPATTDAAMPLAVVGI